MYSSTYLLIWVASRIESFDKLVYSETLAFFLIEISFLMFFWWFMKRKRSMISDIAATGAALIQDAGRELWQQRAVVQISVYSALAPESSSLIRWLHCGNLNTNGLPFKALISLIYVIYISSKITRTFHM